VNHEGERGFVVSGAGRAGLSAACSAAGVGLDVLLLMRDAFPETEGPNDL
jgi:flavin-dependent dehydrogenase